MCISKGEGQSRGKSKKDWMNLVIDSMTPSLTTINVSPLGIRTREYTPGFTCSEISGFLLLITVVYSKVLKSATIHIQVETPPIWIKSFAFEGW